MIVQYENGKLFWVTNCWKPPLFTTFWILLKHQIDKIYLDFVSWYNTHQKIMKLDILMLPSMYNNSVGEASFAYCMQLEILKASSLIFSIVELGSRSILRSNINKKTRSKTCLSFITIELSSSGPSPFLAPMSTTKKVKDLFIIYQYCIVELRSWSLSNVNNKTRWKTSTFDWKIESSISCPGKDLGMRLTAFIYIDTLLFEILKAA